MAGCKMIKSSALQIVMRKLCREKLGPGLAKASAIARVV
jgi:hypothetical protein